MAVVYPKDFTHIFIPKEIDGTTGKAIFEIVHRAPETIIYWHLDDVYAGSTQSSHRMEIAPEPGNHTMTVIDEKRESISWKFKAEKK